MGKSEVVKPDEGRIAGGGQGGALYAPPSAGRVKIITLGDLLGDARHIPEDQQGRFGFDRGPKGLKLWYAGDAALTRNRCVAVVGTRHVSQEGAARARRLARELSEAGVVVMSGLAKGVDTEALNAAIGAGGHVIAVIGTPIDKAYPAENKRLHERIYKEHLLISQFEPGRRVFQSNFPERNKLMAAISDGTVIIEASDKSGTLHQAAECVRLQRPLFIVKSLSQDRDVRWPTKFLNYDNVRVLSETRDVLQALSLGGDGP